MTTKAELSRLKRVELRDCWEREDTDFTPWLAQEENIALLGETIGIELEVQQEEAPVGPFRADILCRDTANDELVIVENQLERTDHVHLGQTLTYAAGLDAVTVIWIAAQYTEEHRATLDWLNRITDDGFRFFGIEIELWRIDDSPVAPKFNLIAKPNDWSKTLKETAGRRGPLTEGQRAQVAFWSEFGAFLADEGAKFKPPKPYHSNWMGWGIGRTGTQLVVVANAGEISIAVDIDTGMHPGWYDQLSSDREDIEAELGFALTWRDKPGNRWNQIKVGKVADTRAAEERAEIFGWMLEHMVAFDRVFRPKLKGMGDGPVGEPSPVD